MTSIATPWDGNPDPPDGIHSGIPFDVYRAIPNRESQSKLKQLVTKTPGQAKWDWDHPKKTTVEMALGTAIDHRIYRGGLPENLVTPPAELLSKYKSWRSSNDGKAWIAEQETAGRIIVSEDDLAMVDRCAEAVLAHPLARRLIEAGEHQLALLWTDPDYGLRRRGLSDTAIAPGHGLRTSHLRVDNESGIVADLKATGAGNAAESSWGRQAARMLYDFQLADYQDALELLTGQYWSNAVHIVVEMTENPRVEVYRMGDAELERGRNDRRRRGEEDPLGRSGVIETYMACTETGFWPTSTTAMQGMGTVKFPPWELRRS